MATTMLDGPSQADLTTNLDLVRAIRRARRARVIRSTAAAYLFLLPTLVFWIIFLLIPVGWVARQSFQVGGVLGPAQWVGLENWKTALHDEALRASITQTLKYTAVVVPASLVIGMAVALILREVRRGGRVLRVLVYLPTLAPLVVVSTIWSFLYNPDFGAFATLAKTAGGHPVNWLGNPHIAIYSIAMVDTWRGVGFWALLLLAALIGVSHDLYSAAKLDRAHGLRRFWHVTLPSIRPTALVAVILATVWAMQVFDIPFVLTGGGPEDATNTAVLYVYKSIFESGKPGMGAVVSMILLIIIMVLTMVFLALARPRRSGARARGAR